MQRTAKLSWRIYILGAPMATLVLDPDSPLTGLFQYFVPSPPPTADLRRHEVSCSVGLTQPSDVVRSPVTAKHAPRAGSKHTAASEVF